MIINLCKKAGYIFLFTILCVLYLPYADACTNYSETFLPLAYQSESNSSNNQDKFGVRLTNGSTSNDGLIKDAAFAKMSPADFKDIFRNALNTYQVLTNLNLFAYQNFRTYARTLKCYEDFILYLQKRIDADKKFKKQTAKIPGFKYSYSVWGGEKSEFHNFVKREAETIIKGIEARERRKHEEDVKRQLELQPRLNVADNATLAGLSKAYDTPCNNFDKKLAIRYHQRADAIKNTISDKGVCFDYSSQVKHPKFTDTDASAFDNCYGTVLDKQLHEELCDTRTTMMELESAYTNNVHVKTFAPLIYQATAQAKKEQSVEKAFNISDFCYDLVQIVSNGVNILTKGASLAAHGAVRGIETELTLQHWKDMGIGLLKFGVFLANENAHLDALDNAFYSTIISGKPDLYLEQCSAYEQHCNAQSQRIQDALVQLKKMSWEDLVENGAYMGTTLILDGIMINAATLITTNAGRAFISQTARALNSPAAKEFALETAGVGKIAVEEGAETVDKAIEIVEKNPELFSQGKLITPMLQDVTNDIKELSKLSICDLKNTQNFKPGALEHILEGELNARGKAVGFHYEGMPTAKGKVISGTETTPNNFGVYTAKVQVNGVPKISNGGESSFFPKDWNAQKIVDSINEALKNKQFVEGTKNTFRGKTSDGVKIEMYVDNVSGKIISAFPKC